MYIYLRAQPASVQKAAKKEELWVTPLIMGGQPLLTIHFNNSMVTKTILDMEKFLEINMSTRHAFKKENSNIV